MKALPLWPLMVLLLAIQRYLASILATTEPDWLEAIHWFGFQWAPWMLLSPLLFYGLLRTHLNHSWLKYHIPWLLLWGVGLVVLHTGIQALLKILFYESFSNTTFYDAFTYLFFAKAHIELLVYMAMAAVVYVVRLVAKNRMMLQRQQQLEAMATKRQLDSMRRQLSPHFLFNALNSLCGLLPEESKGHDMTVAIGDFLHRVLDEEVKQFNSVQHEVAFTECYLMVEQIRFGEQMLVNWKVDPNSKPLQLPSMILQPLVENAVVHCVNAGSGVTQIDISIDVLGGFLYVNVVNSSEHDLVSEHTKGTGKGLQWIKKILEGHYSDKASIQARQTSDRRFKATVKLPVNNHE